MRRIITEPALDERGLPLEGVRQISELELTNLRRIVKAAEEVTSWCYTHRTRAAYGKMKSLVAALDDFNIRFDPTGRPSKKK